jgi:hypothetical protein
MAVLTGCVGPAAGRRVTWTSKRVLLPVVCVLHAAVFGLYVPGSSRVVGDAETIRLVFVEAEKSVRSQVSVERFSRMRSRENAAPENPLSEARIHGAWPRLPKLNVQPVASVEQWQLPQLHESLCASVPAAARVMAVAPVCAERKPVVCLTETPLASDAMVDSEAPLTPKTFVVGMTNDSNVQTLELVGRPQFPDSCRRNNCLAGEPCPCRNGIWLVVVPAGATRVGKIEQRASCGCAAQNASVKKFLQSYVFPKTQNTRIYETSFRFRFESDGGQRGHVAAEKNTPLRLAGTDARTPIR